MQKYYGSISYFSCIKTVKKVLEFFVIEIFVIWLYRTWRFWDQKLLFVNSNFWIHLICVLNFFFFEGGTFWFWGILYG